MENEVRAANPCGVSSEPLRTTAGLHCQSEPDYTPRSLAATNPPWSLGNNFLWARTPTPAKKKLFPMKMQHQQGLGAPLGQMVCPDASQCPNRGSSQAG